MRIDAHQHFWRLERGDYGWLTPSLGSIYRDFLPEHLAPQLAACNIDRTLLIQAAPTVAETQYLLDLARCTPFVAGVVGWIDFDSPDAPRLVERATGEPRLVGLRPMIQDLADDTWMLRTALTPAFRVMSASKLRFDALVQPRHLESLQIFLQRFPELHLVIDHGAKPDIAAGGFATWSRDITRIARQSNAYCKLSGLVTEAEKDYSIEQLRPYVETLLEAFGPRRVMWGSDWPVLNLRCSYADWSKTTSELIATLSASEREWLMGRAACAFYGVPYEA